MTDKQGSIATADGDNSVTLQPTFLVAATLLPVAYRGDRTIPMARFLTLLLTFFVAFSNALSGHAETNLGRPSQALRPRPVSNAATTPMFPRVLVPIYQTTLSDGTVRYSIPIRVGHSQPIQAMLDTGSTGLRVLSGAVPSSDYTLTSQMDMYGYGSGVKIVGTVASAEVAIGGAITSTPIPIQIVQHVGCLQNQPECPASRVAQAAYRLGGDGIPNEGFKAIIGIDMPLAGGRYPIANPLLSLGRQDWIIRLPLPGQSTPGALIINPDAVDLQGFTSFSDLVPMPLFGRQTLAGCLHNLNAGKTFCGPIILDTGTAGVSVNTSLVSPRIWEQGTRGSFSFGDAIDRMPMTSDFTVDSRSPGSRVIIRPQVGPRPTIINAGIVPFFSFAVRYDAKRYSMGLKPRRGTASVQDGATYP